MEWGWDTWSIDNVIDINITRSSGASSGAITLDNARGIYTLNQSDANKSAYIYDDFFAITGFDTQESWLIALPTDINFTTDSHVSWGLWAVNESNNSKAYSDYNYWVAGENAAAATTDC